MKNGRGKNWREIERSLRGKAIFWIKVFSIKLRRAWWKHAIRYRETMERTGPFFAAASRHIRLRALEKKEVARLVEIKG